MFAREYLAMQMVFKDDGVVPNSHLPVVIYRNFLLLKEEEEGVKSFVDCFFDRGWTLGPTYLAPSLHYFAGQHRAIIPFGEATVGVGGRKYGLNLTVKKGDVLYVPAGVGCELLRSSEDFENFCISSKAEVSDLYSEEVFDLSAKQIRAEAMKRIAEVPIPAKDPFFDDNRLLCRWKAA